MTRVAKHALSVGRPTRISNGIPCLSVKTRISSSSPSASARTTGLSTPVSEWLMINGGHLWPALITLTAALNIKFAHAEESLPEEKASRVT